MFGFFPRNTEPTPEERQIVAAFVVETITRQGGGIFHYHTRWLYTHNGELDALECLDESEVLTNLAGWLAQRGEANPGEEAEKLLPVLRRMCLLSPALDRHLKRGGREKFADAVIETAEKVLAEGRGGAL